MLQVNVMNRATSQIRQKETDTRHTSDSLWSNLKYGLAMTAVIVIPPLIPGTSVRLLIMGYMFTIVGIYAAAAIVSAIRTFRPTKPAKRGNKRTNYH